MAQGGERTSAAGGLAGFATAEGTRRYAARLVGAGRTVAGHFRAHGELTASSIGIGTYLGKNDEATDAGYRGAIETALGAGANVVDLAVSYRAGRSERAAGAALASRVRAGIVSRDEVIVATKGGYIPADTRIGIDPARSIADTYIRPGLLREEEIVGGNHAIAPRFLESQIARSLDATGLDSIDVYFIHNPEAQLAEVGRDEFVRRMRAAFALLEAQVAEGRIQRYGVSTWHGLRASPEDRGYVSLAELAAIAIEAGGANHRFRVVQLPLNLLMLEALAVANQAGEWDETAESIEAVTPIEAAERFGLTVWSSASLFQARLARRIPAEIARAIGGLRTDAQRALQFVRSAPGVTVALVGCAQAAHVAENLEVALTPPIPPRQFLSRFFGNA